MFKIEVSGLSTLAARFSAYNTRLTGAKDEGVKAMATMVRNAVRKEFAHEGSGRLYPSRKGRSVRKLTVEAVALGKTIRNAEASHSSRRFIAARKARLSGVTRRLARAAKQGKVAGALHHASSVGESPSLDVGTIVYGIQAGITDNERRVGDVGRWKGFRALHDGGGRLTGSRPYLEIALAKVRPKLSGVCAGVARKQLRLHA